MNPRRSYTYCPETCPDADRLTAEFAATLPEEHREPLRQFVYELKKVTSYRLRSGLQAACRDLDAAEQAKPKTHPWRSYNPGWLRDKPRQMPSREVFK